MKREGNLYKRICSVENLVLADDTARRGKSGQRAIKIHDLDREGHMLELSAALKNKTYRTSEYKTFTVYEPKERLIYCLPYYPDRIVHHAVMNVLEPIFMSVFTADTYSCVKGKGIHACANAVKRALRDVDATRYCLKLDLRKFYPSVDHDILKELLRKKIKDGDLLWLLDGIIDSAPGLPIGNYLSQYFANFYLTYFDHWIKEEKRVKYYFRYADDMVILAPDKPSLRALLEDIKRYLADNLKLEVKGDHQIFPVDARGIDFVGYVFYHDHVLLRKSIKQRFANAVRRGAGHMTIASYRGWAVHCDSKNLLKKLLKDEQIQPIQHKTSCEGLRGREDKDIESAQQGNNRAPFQDRGFEGFRERRSLSAP